MTKILIIISLALIASCASHRYPTHSEKFNGILLTCIQDSTALIKENRVIIKQERWVDKNCLNCKYSACSDKPVYFDMLLHWPSMLGINFKEKSFYFVTNSEPYDPAIKYGEKGFNVHYDVDGGKILVNKKRKEISFSSDYYNWQRIFNYNFSKSDSTLILTAKNDY